MTMANGRREEAANRKRTGISDRDLNKIVEYINQIKFGSVTIVIQDNRVIQIDKNEKIRLI